MKTGSMAATVERQIWSRFRSRAYWIAATAPTVLISLLLYETAKATGSPATAMFLAVVSALWIGGSASVREIVDERKLVQREPHLSLLAYGLAKILHATLMAAGQSAILTIFLLLSGVVGLPFVSLWAILLLTTVSGSMLALLLSALCDEAATALAWFPLVLVPQVVFGGFLFPYGATQPFAFNEPAGEIVLMPEPLIRTTVDDPMLRTAGALSVSRWALESYAAAVFEQDLGDDDNLEEAIQVAFFVPLTLVDEPVTGPLLEYLGRKVADSSTDPPVIAAGAGQYFALLTLFAIVKAVLLVIVLPLRDPRRA